MEQKYDIPTGEEEAARLIEQNDWLKDMIGCTIHPAIPITQPGLRVADMGTGTAIWPLEVAEMLPPDSQIHGFDMSTAHFPRADSLPPNVFLHQQNILEPYPARFLGFFDVVQVRLIILGLRGEDWDKAVENVVALLKPGGCIQWIDPDHSKARIFNLKPGAPASAAREIIDLNAHVVTQLLYPGPLRLPELYEKNGLETIALDIFASDVNPRFRLSHSVMFMKVACQLMRRRMAREDELAAGRAEVLMKKAVEEMETGDLYLHSEMYLVVGRKAEG